MPVAVSTDAAPRGMDYTRSSGTAPGRPPIYRAFGKRAIDVFIVLLARRSGCRWSFSAPSGRARRPQPVLLAGTDRPERSRLPHLETALDGA
jgi:hypothetical protein